MLNKKYLSLALLFIVFYTSLVSASWPLPKWETCDTFNKTREVCDIFWCEVIDCNTTIITNSSTNLSDYYSKEEITALFNDFYRKKDIDSWLVNISSQVSLNITSLRAYSDNQTIALRDSLADRIDNISSVTGYTISNSNVESKPIPPYVYIFGITIFCFLIAFLAWNKSNKKQFQKPTFSIKPPHRPTKKPVAQFQPLPVQKDNSIMNQKIQEEANINNPSEPPEESPDPNEYYGEEEEN